MAMRPKPCIYPALAWTRGSVGRGGLLPTMYDDAAFIAKEVEKLADEGKEVVIVAHSMVALRRPSALRGWERRIGRNLGRRAGLCELLMCLAWCRLLDHQRWPYPATYPLSNEARY